MYVGSGPDELPGEGTKGVNSRQADLTVALMNFVTRIATSESRLWTLTVEAKVTRKQAEDIYAEMKAQQALPTFIPSTEGQPAPFNWCPEHSAYDEHGR